MPEPAILSGDLNAELEFAGRARIDSHQAAGKAECDPAIAVQRMGLALVVPSYSRVCRRQQRLGVGWPSRASHPGRRPHLPRKAQSIDLLISLSRSGKINRLLWPKLAKFEKVPRRQNVYITKAYSVLYHGVVRCPYFSSRSNAPRQAGSRRDRSDVRGHAAALGSGG